MSYRNVIERNEIFKEMLLIRWIIISMMKKLQWHTEIYHNNYFRFHYITFFVMKSEKWKFSKKNNSFLIIWLKENWWKFKSTRVWKQNMIKHLNNFFFDWLQNSNSNIRFFRSEIQCNNFKKKKNFLMFSTRWLYKNLKKIMILYNYFTYCLYFLI